MEKTESIIYSLIPIVIIILISWAFSFLASRKQKQQDGSESESEMSPRTQFLQFLSDDEEDEEEMLAEQDMSRARAEQHADIDAWAPEVPTSGPEVTPKPIEPKWWRS